MSQSVTTSRDGQILHVILDRPKANAIDAATSRELGEAFAHLRDDDSLIVATVTGGGDKFFSAGWDLKAAAGGKGEGDDYGVGGFAGLTEMFDLNKPVIAAVNGMAVGGGFELALACDIIVASEQTVFMFPELNVGNMADAGGVQRLPRRLPHHVAMDMLLTGRRMNAEEAARYGLVNYVVAHDQVVNRAKEIARVIAGGAPLSVQAIKEAVRSMENMSVEEAFQAVHTRNMPAYVRMLGSEDYLEGPRAFAEGRQPIWKGR